MPFANLGLIGYGGRMSVQTKHRFNVTEYYRMAETGVLRPGARVELLNGEIIDASPIGPFHGSITKHLNQIFTVAAHGRWITQVQDPVRLDDYSEPEPDLALVKPVADFYRRCHPQPEDVFLLIEISDSTLEEDQGNKIRAYGRAGIMEVWIVNLNELTIEVYREPHYAGYGSKTVLRAGDTLAPLAFPDATVDVAELLKC
jgi:Uma2 family endonuclease